MPAPASPTCCTALSRSAVRSARWMAAKRVLMLDASATEPDVLYGAIEVGGAIRSVDGGEHWENLSHGQYINDDTVDVHGVLASRWRPGTVIGIARAGMFRRDDGGDHWRHGPLEAPN